MIPLQRAGNIPKWVGQEPGKNCIHSQYILTPSSQDQLYTAFIAKKDPKQILITDCAKFFRLLVMTDLGGMHLTSQPGYILPHSSI